jgi:hypothetical protein
MGATMGDLYELDPMHIQSDDERFKDSVVAQLIEEGVLRLVTIDRETLVAQIAGFISTIEFIPSENHPLSCDAYADQIVTMVFDAAVRETDGEAAEREWNEIPEIEIAGVWETDND